jgi:hypothetical protein
MGPTGNDVNQITSENVAGRIGLQETVGMGTEDLERFANASKSDNKGERTM